MTVNNASILIFRNNSVYIRRGVCRTPQYSNTDKLLVHLDSSHILFDQQHLPQSMEDLGIPLEKVIFQQDNDLKHTSKLAQNWLNVTLYVTLYWNSDFLFLHASFPRPGPDSPLVPFLLQRPLCYFYHIPVPSSNFCPFDPFQNSACPTLTLIPIFPILLTFPVSP